MTARQLLKEAPVLLDAAQRGIVEQVVRDHCNFRHWVLPAVNVRTNHVHLVVTADVAPEDIINQLKAWCSRRLNEHSGSRSDPAEDRRRWWTRHGSTKWINDEQYFRNAIRYVLERQ
jgi:REP element-mobilizing transposase RayT